MESTAQKRALVLRTFADVSARFIPVVFDENKVRVLVAMASSCESKNVVQYSQIAELAGMSDGASLNYSLRSLREEGLVFNERNGTSSYYGLTPMGSSVAGFIFSIYRAFAEFCQAGVQELKGHGITRAELYKAFNEVNDSLRRSGVPLTTELVKPSSIRARSQ